MLAYYVRWELVDNPSPKRGRPSKENLPYYSASILCNNISEAMSCFTMLFRREYLNEDITIDDGRLSFNRMKLDSRNFHIQWLFMKGLNEPISLVDPAKSIFLKHSYL